MKLSKKNLRLLILAGVLLVAVIVLLCVKNVEETQEKIKNSNEVVLTLKEEEVTALSWESDDSTFALHKEDDTWKYDEDDAFPVNAEKISSLLSQFMSLETKFVIEDVTDYAQYGLKSPGLTIHITVGEKTYDIKVGDYSTMDNQRYISIGDGKVYLVEHDPISDYKLALSDLIQNDSIPYITDVDSVTFSGAENYTIVKQDDKYMVGEKAVSSGIFASYIKSLINIGLTDYKTYNASEDELKECGLDTPSLSISVKSGDYDFTVSIGSADDEYYARIDDSKIIYIISDDTYDNLISASYNDLRDKSVITADFDHIDKAEIKLDGETYEFVKKESTDAPGYDLADLEETLTTLSADTFVTTKDSTKEEISFTLYLSDEDTDKVTITFYRHDGEFCTAVVDGEVVSLVARDKVVALIEAVHSTVL